MQVNQAIKHLRDGRIVGLAPPLNTWFKLTKRGVWLRFLNWKGRKWAFYGPLCDLKRFDGEQEFILPYYGEQFEGNNQ